MGLIREVWSHNLCQELAILYDYLVEFPIVSVDTEFPGFLINTPRGASEEEFYNDLQFNVNQMKLIQLGITVSDESGCVAMTWQFNFGDFDEDEDAQDTSSISFLRSKGLDFEKLRREGIASEEFTTSFLPICRGGRVSKWVTFHGFYDIAYLLKLLKIRALPNSMEMFATTVQHLLGNVSDIKHMARHCEGLLNGELGLEKLANLLRVKRIGTAHQAGSDSLLTASLYAKMQQKFELPPDQCEGFLYGLSYRIQTARRAVVKIVDPSQRQIRSSSSPEPFNWLTSPSSKWRVLYVEVKPYEIVFYGG